MGWPDAYRNGDVKAADSMRAGRTYWAAGLCGRHTWPRQCTERESCFGFQLLLGQDGRRSLAAGAACAGTAWIPVFFD